MPSRRDYSIGKEKESQDFERIIKEHGASIARVSAIYARTAADRDDLSQEIAVALWQALPRFRGDCSERTFVFRVAHNRAVSYLARRRIHDSLTGEEPGGQPDPESDLLREERSAALFRAIRQLPIVYRQVMSLVLEGLEHAEVGQVLGISENNVAVRMNRARQMLRESLEAYK
jgi:RNA polymerase sigma factor (sigma-70 family)